MTGVDAMAAAHVDEVLATTRAVRRRLDLARPVDSQLLLECIDLAAEVAGELPGWRHTGG